MSTRRRSPGHLQNPRLSEAQVLVNRVFGASHGGPIYNRDFWNLYPPRCFRLLSRSLSYSRSLTLVERVKERADYSVTRAATCAMASSLPSPERQWNRVTAYPAWTFIQWSKWINSYGSQIRIRRHAPYEVCRVGTRGERGLIVVQ